MTVTVFTVPLVNPRKDLVVKTTAVATSSLVNTAIAAGLAAIIIDDALIDLALIKSGLVYVPAEEMGDNFLEHNGLYTSQAALQSAYSKCKHANPKLTKVFALVDPAVTTLAGVLNGGYDVAYIVNSPAVTKRMVGLAYVANTVLSDYLRESLP